MDLKGAKNALVQPKTSSKDPVIEAMEKFMKETENVELQSVIVRKGKLYDTENLLHILGSKSGKSSTPTPSDKPKMRVLPKRRKTQEKVEDAPPKKGRPNKTPRKTPLRLQYAKIHRIPIVEWETCQEMFYPKKRKAKRVYHCNQQAKVVQIDIRNDSVVCKNNGPTVKVKEEVEVIDLTNQDENSCYMLLHFAKEQSLDQMNFEIAEEIAPIQYCKAIVSEVASEVAVVTVPDVRNDVSIPVVDLTQIDKESAPPVVVSEKQCANAILPIIYRFHEISHSNEEEAKYEKFKSVGRHLVQTLSGMFVKNINMARFLEFVVSKLGEKFRLILNAATVAFYLKMMFDGNRQACNNRLTQFLLNEIDGYYAPVKSDALGVVELEAEVITQDQLQQLANQIRQYRELFMDDAVTIDIDEEYCDDYVFSLEEDEKVDGKCRTF